jgi:hypothetical protein
MITNDNKYYLKHEHAGVLLLSCRYKTRGDECLTVNMISSGRAGVAGRAGMAGRAGVAGLGLDHRYLIYTR